jgi:hypothetical protein
LDRYHIALFIHVVTLMVAAGATAMTKFAATRRERARTVGETLEWHDILSSTAKLFPICLLAFVVTGFYMLSQSHAAIWSSGFVVGGLVGVVLLLASGVFLATKGRALRQVLAEMAKNAADTPAPNLTPPPLVATLPFVNTGIVLGVVFDMVTKPASLVVALSALAIGILVGAALAMRRPAPTAASIPTTS